MHCLSVKSSLILTIIVGFGALCLAQDVDDTKFNLPPGASLTDKFRLIDLSAKLDQGASKINYVDDDLRFLKVLSEEQLQMLQGTDYYNYIMEARAYIKSLSDAIKAIYTEAELLYIYAFDLPLKERILEIR